MKKIYLMLSACLLLNFGAATADEDPLTQLIFNNVLSPASNLSSNDNGRADVADGKPAKVTGDRVNSDDLLMSALSLIGIQYKFGGNTPETGFDCSGFVRYVFSQSVGIALPRSAAEISNIGKNVNRDELQPGDLVFFNTMKRAFSHVGIYMGNGKFIHSPRTGSAVQVVDMGQSYWRARFDGARRISKSPTVKQ
ncbi:C40 family peptidase [Leeia sp. TBRC 13508]|uniref:C40 family peptidase n=1 Tax=Leeia speluncae TaxID=2884804 RepID=A0ABS8D8E6_9NEIS|nr:C40 family peptidase [Leeia speluncae]MCB6184465.1 C40 family peptidase [Leeia speluncae]